MFGFSWMRQRLQSTFERQAGLLAGVAFMALAMASIQYDENVAPHMSRLSDGWSSAAADVGRKLFSS